MKIIKPTQNIFIKKFCKMRKKRKPCKGTIKLLWTKEHCWSLWECQRCKTRYVKFAKGKWATMEFLPV